MGKFSKRRKYSTGDLYRVASALVEDYLKGKRTLSNVRKELRYFYRLSDPKADMAYVFREIKKDYGVDLKTGKKQSLTRKIGGKIYRRADIALGRSTLDIVFTNKKKAQNMCERIREYENKNAVIVRRNNRYEIYVRSR